METTRELKILKGVQSREKALRWFVGILLAVVFSLGGFVVGGRTVRAEVDNRIDRVEQRLNTEVDAMEERLSERLASIEGHLLRVEEKLDRVIQEGR